MSFKTLQYALWGLVAVVGGAAGGYFYMNGLAPKPVVTTTGTAAIGGPFVAVDHNGATITEAAFSGSPSLVFFGFTHCPEICPTTLSDMAGWLAKMGDDGQTIKSYFVTVDPERDTPVIMKDYVTAFSDRITGITGTPEQVERLLKNYRVYSRKVRTGDGNYTMDHSAVVILLDAKSNFVSTIAYGEDEGVALDKLKLLVKRG